MATNWSDRDAAVVPWISLSNSSAAVGDGAAASSQAAAAAAAAPGGSEGDGSHQNLQASASASTTKRHPNYAYTSSCKLTSLLSARERIGSKGGGCNRIGWLTEGVVVTHAGLARVGAW